MSNHADIPSEVALMRDARSTSSRKGKPQPGGAGSKSRARSKPKGTTPPRHRKKSTPSRKRSGGDSDVRLRHIVSIVLALGALLLFIALISYSRLDQANADISPLELGGLLSNDPAMAERAHATVNWLGLVGAYMSNALINGTIGWFVLLIPSLLALWSVTIYRNRETSVIWQRTMYALGAGVIGSALLGTISRFQWTPTLSPEWHGAIGGFLSSLVGGLLGSAGAFLSFTALLIIVALYLFETDLRTTVHRLSRLFGTLWVWSLEHAGSLKGMISSELGRERTGSMDSTRSRATIRKESEPQEVEESIVDHEPAHMIRRVRETRPEQDETEGSKVETTAPSPMKPATTKSSTPPPDVEPTAGQKQASPGAEREAPPAISPAPQEEPEQGFADVALTRTDLEEPAPEETPASPVLRVKVEERDTVDDQEVDSEGNLIEPVVDEQIKYDPPSIEMLAYQESHEEVEDDELKTHARLLQEKLRTFNIEIEDLTVTPGPVVTLFEFVPAAGIKLSQIESLGDDIALALKARGIRIIAPIPGKGTVGVEIPNRQPALVRIRSVLNTTKFREADHHLPLALGKTTVGEVFCADLAKMPHLLIAGATGAGKSVGINSILVSLLYKMHPSDLKLAIIDPKKIELTQYKALIDHYLVSCPDIDEDIVTDPQNAVILLKSLELEMDRRYDMLAKSGQRNIFDYNSKIEEGKLTSSPGVSHRKLPYIVLIIDELADLMITASKEVEEPIARLAQLARAIGIHIIVATQRPSVDVLTGMIKANFPARIAYQVATKIDSRTILDMNGAEQLLGNGDMLYLPGGRPKPLRLQNAFVTTEEVEAICEHIGSQSGYTSPFTLPSLAEKKKQSAVSSIDERDALFDEAAHVIVRHQQGSVSLLQRRLKVGYARAARIVDELEDAGIVGPFDGSKARAVLLESEAELEAYL